MKKISTLLLLVAIFFAGCKPNLSITKPQAGNAVFSKYLAVGTSYTAGFADNSLYRNGQLNSYPAILATQFMKLRVGNFVQPLLPTDAGWPQAKLVLSDQFDCLGHYGLKPVNGQIDTIGSAVSIASQ